MVYLLRACVEEVWDSCCSTDHSCSTVSRSTEAGSCSLQAMTAASVIQWHLKPYFDSIMDPLLDIGLINTEAKV